MDKVGLAFDALEGVHVLNRDRHFNEGEKLSWSESLTTLEQKLQYIEYELAIIANGGPSLGSENRMIKGIPNTLYHSVYPFKGVDLYPEFWKVGRGPGSVTETLGHMSVNWNRSADFAASGFNACPHGYYALAYRNINSKLGFYLNTRDGRKVTALVPRGMLGRNLSPAGNLIDYEPWYHHIVGGTNQFGSTWQMSLPDNMMMPRGNMNSFVMTYIDVPLQDFKRHSTWEYSDQLLKKIGIIDTFQTVFKDTMHVQVEGVGQLVMSHTMGIARPHVYKQITGRENSGPTNTSFKGSFTDMRLFARLNFPVVVEGEGVRELAPGDHLLSFTARIDINTCVLVCSDKNASISSILVYSHRGVIPVKYHKRRAREYLQVNFDLPDDDISAELNNLQVVVLCTTTQTSTLVLQSIGEA